MNKLLRHAPILFYNPSSLSKFVRLDRASEGAYVTNELKRRAHSAVLPTWIEEVGVAEFAIVQ